MKVTLMGAAMQSVLTTTVVSKILEIDNQWGISETKADALRFFRITRDRS